MRKIPLEETKDIFNKHRRTFLTVAGTGVVAFILGKIFGPSVNLFTRDTVINDKEFKNFRVVETRKEMKLFDRGGNEIFIIDKESFQE